MRKHFLILMLFALLPLAGWAAVTTPEGKTPYEGSYVDLSNGWSIQLEYAAKTYTGADIAPAVFLVKGDKYIAEAGHFNVEWNTEHVKDFVLGGYTVTVTADNTYSFNALEENTANFMVLKANLVPTAYGALQTDPASPQHYDVDTEITLVKTAPTIKIGTAEGTAVAADKIMYAATASDVTVAPSAGWSTASPKVKNVGVYKVWYKVEATTNYNELVGTVGDGATYTILGNDYSAGDYVAPEGLTANPTFDWNNNSAVEYNLVKSGTGTIASNKGTFKYAVDPTGGDPTAWNWTAEAKASSAKTHTVYWKIDGAAGYNGIAYDADHKFTQKINQVATVISFTAADHGQSNISYKTTGDHNQPLLKAAATATKGASSLIKYRKRYSSNVETPSWGGWTTATANIAEVTGDNAGLYEIEALIEYDENGNYASGTEAKSIQVTIGKADALTAAPTANDLTWNKANQKLITATGTVANVVEYRVEAGNGQAVIDWTNNINAVIGKNAGNYTVKYRVMVDNYKSVPAENTADGIAIPNVMIKRKDLSVKVKDITKTYNAKVDYEGATLAGTATAAADENRFTFLGRLSGDGLSFTSALVPYVDLDEACKNAGSYTDAVTVAEEKLNAVSTNYRYTIIPGNLTINKAKLTVTANDVHVTFGNPYDISNEYVIAGLQNNGEADEVATDAFSTVPVLTTTAAAINPAPDVYPLAFTKGVLKTNGNYEMDTTYGDGDNKDGYKIGEAKFTVDADPEAKIIITVLPHSQKYTGVAESWDNMVEGVDYHVTGLIAGDHLTTAPTFSRTQPTKYDAGTYTLKAEGAAVADISLYPGKIIYQNSTFTIEPVELTANLVQQTIAKTTGVTPDDIEIANAALDPDAWTVEGLVNDETKAVLKGKLTVNNVGTGEGKTNISAADFYNQGIVLTITSTNYTLKAGTQYATLRVIDAASTIELDPTNAELAELIEASKYVPASDNKYNVTFAHKSLKANTWYTMVLPFEVKTAELVASLKAGKGTTAGEHSVYAIVNRMNESTTADKINFTLEMLSIPANEPFLIKTAEDVNMQDVTFAEKKIISANPTIEYGGNEFIGTFTAVTNLPEIYNTTNKHYAFLATGHKGSKGQTLANTWWNANLAGLVINPMEGYLHYAYTATGAAPVITIEDFDFETGTTAIKTLNAETMKAYSVDGWYTLNGVKLQGVPTEKGVYINNGKKVVIK